MLIIILQENKVSLNDTNSSSIRNTSLTRFKTSPLMPLYFAYIFIFDFNYLERIVNLSTKNVIKLRIYSTPQQIRKTQLALQASEEIMIYYSAYLKTDISVNKIGKNSIQIG